MRILVLCMLVWLLCPNSEETLLVKIRWRPPEQDPTQYLKRHSEGTFSNDYSHNLDKIKAKNFVEWLSRTKQHGCHAQGFHLEAEI